MSISSTTTGLTPTRRLRKQWALDQVVRQGKALFVGVLITMRAASGILRNLVLQPQIAKHKAFAATIVTKSSTSLMFASPT